MPYLDKSKSREYERQRYLKRKGAVLAKKQSGAQDLFSSKYVRTDICPITGFPLFERRSYSIEN